MHPPTKPFAGSFQQIHPTIPIPVIFKHRLSAVSTRHYVVNRPCRFVSQWSSHGKSSDQTSSSVNDRLPGLTLSSDPIVLNLVVVADEEENQFCRCCDEHECQPVIQADPALENGLCEPTNPDAGMQMRPSPTLKNPIDRIADFLTLRLRLGAKDFKQLVSDPCLQEGLRCLR